VYMDNSLGVVARLNGKTILYRYTARKMSVDNGHHPRSAVVYSADVAHSAVIR